jgi:predicted secreted hydrolase
MIRRNLLILLALGSVVVASSGTAWATAFPRSQAQAADRGPVRLPGDEAAHRQPSEWWYFSGHLWGVDPQGALHYYGYEYVTFQFLGLGPSPVYFGNLGLTDLTRGTFQYDVHQDSYPIPTVANGFAVRTAGWRMHGAGGRNELHADLPGYRLALSTAPLKPAAVNGRAGTIDFGPFGTSKYYSRTALLTRGTIIDHGMPVTVIGTSWMDHQWGAFDYAAGGGWDWFSMQLTNGEQYMVYIIRNSDGTVATTTATRVERSGSSSVLRPRTFGDRTLGSWTSPRTDITYGSGWTVTLPGGRLQVRPDLLDQELDLRSSQGVAYWEGSVSIHGTLDGKPVTGVGYTEINPPGQP